MYDQNWEVINGEAAHAIEVLNQSNQVNVIEALVHLLSHVGQIDPLTGCTHYPNDAAVRELHRTGTLFLLNRPGEYRDCVVHVGIGDKIVYVPPPPDQVTELVKQFIQHLGSIWKESSPVSVTAYCLWRINWIHPFKNGNGRTARAFAYACMCLKLGFIPGGSPTVLDLIMGTKPEFEKALSVADESFKITGIPDLSLMESYVERLLIEQLSSIPSN